MQPNYPETAHKISNTTPHPPILKAQLKLHKPGAPIRPVVNNRTAPSYKLAKKLNNTLINTYTLITTTQYETQPA
jgi:hypothetical protein